jgi:two-component SAPR family response regulator
MRNTAKDGCTAWANALGDRDSYADLVLECGTVGCSTSIFRTEDARTLYFLPYLLGQKPVTKETLERFTNSTAQSDVAHLVAGDDKAGAVISCRKCNNRNQQKNHKPKATALFLELNKSEPDKIKKDKAVRDSDRDRLTN